MVHFLTPTPIHPIDENMHFSSGQNLNQMSNSTTTTCQAPSQNATTSTAATTKTIPTHTNALDLNNSNNMNFNGFNNITLQNNLNFNSSNNLFIPTNNMTFNSSNNLSLHPNNHFNLNNNHDINFNSCNDLTHPYHQNNNYHFNRSNAIKFSSSDHSDGPNDNSSNYITCSKREVMFRIHNQAKSQEPNLVVATTSNSAQQITLSFTLKRPTNKRSSCTKNRYNIISTSPQNIIKPMIATSKESKELLSKAQHFLSSKPVNNK
ncbi:hypothetical protein TRFO_24011 [Tritrichomonas foetus]|uniref:Uncharacterized protein n=1 Tax=Tritrichomonas foetus TaxID=1144522 RepID=A0A1J4KDE0_9EUKA|nr:hypothetical protein TRFO_24011 [Tritrichomonas foetus]|eukprot:OHT07732.1 hypothetical protein TRFO_24011 [Tritrichomonas foetus]